MLSLLASHRVTFGLFHLLPSVRAAEGYTVVRERLIITYFNTKPLSLGESG